MGQLNITAGMLKQVFKFENPVKSANSSAGQNEMFTEFYTTRGYLKQLSGNRNFDTGRDLLVELYEMVCYWRSALETNITKDTRIVYDNKFFRIERMERMDENRTYYRFELSEAS